MNTVKSVYYGWGTLILAGGGAYFFAKKSINKDRAEKAEAERLRKQRQREMEAHYIPPPSVSKQSVAGGGVRPNADWAQSSDDASNPSKEASHDPAPTRHEPETAEQRVWEKSKYESSDPWRSKKGDRLS